MVGEMDDMMEGWEFEVSELRGESSSSTRRVPSPSRRVNGRCDWCNQKMILQHEAISANMFMLLSCLLPKKMDS
jgi:hypothetical protein